MVDQEDQELPRRSEGVTPAIARLPLFSRCPITNKAKLEAPVLQDESVFPKVHADMMGAAPRMARIPLNSISNVSANIARSGGFSNSTSGWRTFAQLQDQDNSSRNQIRNAHKPSLDEVRDNSVVAMTNKHGKGKYWFKSACPTPDPRWGPEQQLMIGPIPGDVEYSQLRSAFLAQGHTLHLFIQNNQGWLEKNQEKFGEKHVKFGYVVYTERETAARLLFNGFVPVGPVRIRVKQMDGKPAIFY